MRVRYEVKWCYHQYNTGSANNGTVIAISKFDIESQAKEFIARVNGDARFRESLVEDGYFIKIMALLCIMEWPLELPNQPEFNGGNNG